MKQQIQAVVPQLKVRSGVRAAYNGYYPDYSGVCNGAYPPNPYPPTPPYPPYPQPTYPDYSGYCG